MLRAFKNGGLQKFFETGSTRGINAQLAKRVKTRLDVMNVATEISDIAANGWNLHQLQGEREGVWSLKVNGPWRITFRFENGDCVDVDLEQYH